MKIYTSLKSIPELADLTPQERLIAWHSCQGKTNAHWQTRVGSFVALLAAVAVGGGILYLFIKLSPAALGMLPTFFIGGFVGGVIIVGVFQFFRRIVVFGQVGPYLREYLEEKERPGNAGNSLGD